MHSTPEQFFKPSCRAVIMVSAVIALLCMLALIWRLLPIDTWLSRDNVTHFSFLLKNDPLAPFYVVLLYTLSGLIAFPIIILIPATAMIFGPLLGLLYSLCGLVANASVLYGLGHFLGRETIRHYAGNRVQQISHKLARNGFVTVALLRLFPVAPFFLINLISGASPITFRTYTFATVTGIAPALILMTLAGTQLENTLHNPAPTNFIPWVVIAIMLLVSGRWIRGKVLKRTDS